MFKNVDIYTQRYIQIVIVLMIIQAIYQYMHIPHNSWLITASCAIYGGFNSSTVLKKAYLRIQGTLVGIAMVVIMWHIIHFDYRLLIMVTTSWMILWIFFSQLPYNRIVIFTTTFADISVEWSNSDTFNLSYYISDRLICNFIVFGVCIAIENIWFKKKNLSFLSYQQTQKLVYASLEKYYQIALARNSSAKGLKINSMLLQNIDKLTNLANDAKYEGNNKVFSEKLEQMLSSSREIHSKIVSLRYLNMHLPNDSKIIELTKEIKEDLAYLAELIK